MIRSMTGYGAARRTGPWGVVSVEARSVNNRYFDLSFRGLRDIAEWESEARRIVQKHVRRGKVEIGFSWEKAPSIQPRLVINRDLLNQLEKDIQDVAEQWGATPAELLAPIGAIPGVMETRLPDIDAQAVAGEFAAVLNEALERFDEARIKEGAALADDFLARAKTLRQQCETIRAAKDEVIVKYRARLAELAASVSEGAKAAISPDRLEAEVALYADRCDITEELVRLDAHIHDLETKLRSSGDEPVGKALEFLAQELLREANTIGSKARDTSVIQTTLQMKNEIERIREQIQNIE